MEKEKMFVISHRFSFKEKGKISIVSCYSDFEKAVEAKDLLVTKFLDALNMNSNKIRHFEFSNDRKSYIASIKLEEEFAKSIDATSETEFFYEIIICDTEVDKKVDNMKFEILTNRYVCNFFFKEDDETNK